MQASGVLLLSERVLFSARLLVIPLITSLLGAFVVNTMINSSQLNEFLLITRYMRRQTDFTVEAQYSLALIFELA